MKKQPCMRLFKPVAAALVLASLAACGGGDSVTTAEVAEDVRAQDSRLFTPAPEATFAELVNSAVDTDRWTGVLKGAAYRIEVPKTGWNGKLVMWAHGYRGADPNLTVDAPIMRRYLLDKGYAWAASSYAKNYYDVRAGVEDTNALALNFSTIAAANNRPLAAPSKIFITGVSLGGHITAAAIDAEAQASAVNKVKYAGAVPMCGVLGDTELFNYFAGYQMVAQQLAGVPITSFPVTNFEALTPTIRAALWSSYPTQTNAQGDKLKNVVMNLSGGSRPFYAEGWANASNQNAIWSSLGDDGTINGILTQNVLDTTAFTYKIDASSAATTAEDNAFNASIFKIRPALDANRLRRDGLRWIPATNADFNVPVVSLHTLGDLFVPFKMEQVFYQRAKSKGSDKFLVQRAIRDVGHCAFTAAEATAAFDAMVLWEAGGPKPAGDDVVTAATVAAPTYGCAFTNNTPSTEDFTPPAVRAGFQANYPKCQ